MAYTIFVFCFQDTKRIHRQTKALLCQLRDSVQEKNDTVKADIAFYLEKESKDESAKHEIEAKFQILRANKEKDLAAIKEEVSLISYNLNKVLALSH